MKKKKTKLQIAQEHAEVAIKNTNLRIDELGRHTGELYIALNNIQNIFDEIRNVPSDKKLKYEELKLICLNWKQQVERIEEDYKKAVAKNAGKGAAGVGVGVAVAALGPSAAMGIATTFGVASTGTAISALSGAAATNAALAWLGGGALAAGGGGMAAGNALLVMAGPVGVAIAGITLLGSGLMFLKGRGDKKSLEDVFSLISKRDVKSYELAIVELNERIERIIKETAELKDAVVRIGTFGLDYQKMSETQQYELGAYVNLMAAATQLLINPVIGLQPKYNEHDFDLFVEYRGSNKKHIYKKYKNIIISLANLLYKIKLDTKEKKLLWKSFKKNKEFLESMKVSKKDFDFDVFKISFDVLDYKMKRVSINQAYHIVKEKNRGFGPHFCIEFEKYYGFNYNSIASGGIHCVDKETGEYKSIPISESLKFKHLNRYEGKEFISIIES